MEKDSLGCIFRRWEHTLNFKCSKCSLKSMTSLFKISKTWGRFYLPKEVSPLLVLHFDESSPFLDGAGKHMDDSLRKSFAVLGEHPRKGHVVQAKAFSPQY